MLKPLSRQKQQLAHVRAWWRHSVSMFKLLWSAPVRVKAIYVLLGVSKEFVDHAIRRNICPEAWQAVHPW